MLYTTNAHDVQEAEKPKISPIELLFWEAAKSYCGDRLRLVAPSRFPGELYGSAMKAGVKFQVDDIIIAHQVDVVGYIVDFAVTRPWVACPTVYIECDGHEFHERTKEQAARDRSRDRFVQHFGRIHRFTGSEIWRDAEVCWEQTLEALEAAARHQDRVAQSTVLNFLTEVMGCSLPDDDTAFAVAATALYRADRSASGRVKFSNAEWTRFRVTEENAGMIFRLLAPWFRVIATTSGSFDIQMKEPWLSAMLKARSFSGDGGSRAA